MLVSISNKALAIWLEQQLEQPYLPALLNKIGEQQRLHELVALAKGDTEYEKGQADALNWAVGLPNNIIKSTGVDTNTDEDQ